MASNEIKLQLTKADIDVALARSTLVLAFIDEALAKECHDEATRLGLSPSPLQDGCFGIVCRNGPLFDALIEWVSTKGVKQRDREFEWAIVESGP